jgi:trans-4-hydroxy-L-proline dehydratase
MTERVARLRQQSLDQKPTLSSERAELMTAFYRDAPSAPLPVLRALSFQYVMDRKALCILPDELIVGERGPEPKATPTYPELCCHTLEDLDILDSREKISFAVDQHARDAYRNTVIPYWRERSMRHRMFQELPDPWKHAYEAGVFTEFMEQRAPGHTVADDKIYAKGLAGLQADIDRELAALDDLHDLRAYDRRQQLKGMRMAADAVIRFARRHAEEATRLAAVETNPARKAELEQVAANCAHVPEHPARTFWEALQAYWFVHLGVITELNTWDSFCPGRLDQHLYPYYKRELEAGTLTRERAKELLQCFWVKFNSQPAPPKVGVTAAESGTYTDFANISNGGLKADGSDGVNDVSYLVLEVIDEMRLLQPSSNIQLSKKNPDRFLKKACEVIRKGWGQPSVFNADMVVAELVRQGKSVEDARCGGTSGCVEAGAFGKESYILTGYFNLPKVIEITMNDGYDPRTERQIGPKTGDPATFTSFDQVLAAFRTQLQHFIDVKIAGSHIIERMYATLMPAPFLSIITDDCVKKGVDYNAGGARYNTRYIMPVGPGTAADSLSALKYHVFDHRNTTLAAITKAVRADFIGHEALRQLLVNKSPKYGNDDEYADAFVTQLCEELFTRIDGRKGPTDSTYHVNYLSTTCHVYFGSVCGATPDGRHAWVPVSDGISPAHGADRNGPTAVIRSAARMDHARSGGTLLNQKFTPSTLEGPAGIDQLAHLVRAYFKLDGHHIQFNVVTADTLRKAQAEPEKYRDLIVRVAGYSDYFCDLTKGLQDEIIERTEQKGF